MILFLDNKYTKVYYALTRRAELRILDTYTEGHHIIPKSLGGSDEQNNIVQLTAREHFIAHWLLSKMTTGKSREKMVYALHMMRASSDKHQRYATKITARVYARYREEISNLARQQHAGKPKSTEHKEKIRQALLGHKHSAERKKKAGAAKLGKTYEEIYGVEKAKQLKLLRRENKLGKPSPLKGKPSPMRGRILSEEHKEKIRQTKAKKVQ